MRIAVVAWCLLAAGCGDDDGAPRVDAGSDAGAPDAGADAGPDWAGPVAPARPELSCATGWRAITDTTGTVTGCDPWPASGRATCTEIDEAHFVGEPGCRRVGTACPVGDYAEDLPAGMPVAYVRPGAMGGDGSMALPFGTIDEALITAAPGTIIALSKGRHAGGARFRAATVVRGACVSETSIGPASPFQFLVSSMGVSISNVRFEGGPPIYVPHDTGLELRDVVSDDARDDFVSLMGGTLTLQDVIVRRSGQDSVTNIDGMLTMSRVVIEASDWGLLRQLGGTSMLSDIAVSDTVGLAVFTVDVTSGARLTIERFASDGVSAWNVEDGSTVELSDALIRGAEATIKHESDALQVYDPGTSLVVRRARFEQVLGTAMIVTSGSSATLEDVVISGPRPNGIGSGRGITVELASRAVMRRVVIERASQAAIVAQGGAMVMLEDVDVRETRVDLMGQLGHGIHVQQGASLEGMRVRVATSREVGVLGVSAGTVVHLVEVDVDATMLGGTGAAIGVGSYAGASVSLESARVRASAIVGIQVTAASELDVHVGEVTDNVVGANVQVDGFDFARLSDRVRYLRNERNLDSNMLPVPTTML